MNRQSLFLDLIHDEAGFLISAELVLISTTVVLGLTAGLVCVRNAVVAELTDVGEAFNSLNQSYCYTGMHACKSFACGTKSHTAGSSFFDRVDGSEQVHADFDAPQSTAPAVEQQNVQPAPAPVPAAEPVPQVIPQALPVLPVDCPPVANPPVSYPVAPSVFEYQPVIGTPCPASVIECAPAAVLPAPEVQNCPPALGAPTAW